MVVSNYRARSKNLTLRFIIRESREAVSWAFNSSELRDREGGSEKKEAELRDKRRHDFNTGNSRGICVVHTIRASNKEGRPMNQNATNFFEETAEEKIVSSLILDLVK